MISARTFTTAAISMISLLTIISSVPVWGADEAGNAITGPDGADIDLDQAYKTWRPNIPYGPVEHKPSGYRGSPHYVEGLKKRQAAIKRWQERYGRPQRIFKTPGSLHYKRKRAWEREMRKRGAFHDVMKSSINDAARGVRALNEAARNHAIITRGNTAGYGSGPSRD